MAVIFRKTDKGQTEIETRANRLAPRLRSALILVDGKRSSDELRSMIIQQADETLAALNEQGFIEAAAVVPSMPAAPAAANQAAVEAPDRAPSGAGGPTRQRDFEALRRQMVREFNDITGPSGEPMAMRLEKATDRMALRALLQAAGEYISGSRGNQASIEFRQRFTARLDA